MNLYLIHFWQQLSITKKDVFNEHNTKYYYYYFLLLLVASSSSLIKFTGKHDKNY